LIIQIPGNASGFPEFIPDDAMTPSGTCSIAFKEWAAICEALAAGRQNIILRKGGIQEGREGFRVQHREFWLYPTNFHEAAGSLAPEAGEFIARAAAGRRDGGVVPIRHLAVVHEVRELSKEEEALRLAGLHLWSEATVRQRFHYRRPGLFLLVVRVFSRPTPQLVEETGEMAGCKSWVTLPDGLSTADIAPALSDEQFGAMRAQLPS
jgi:hypothetical protein